MEQVPRPRTGRKPNTAAGDQKDKSVHLAAGQLRPGSRGEPRDGRAGLASAIARLSLNAMA